MPINDQHLRALLLGQPYRDTIEAADAAFDRELAWLHGKVPTHLAVWAKVTSLLIARALQLQRAVIDGAVLGYDEELNPAARAMLSSVLTLTAIAHGSHREQDGKALQYLTFGRQGRRRWLRYNIASRWISAQAARQYDAAEATEEDALLARAAAEGIAPVRLGNRTDTWSGLSDRELFTRMGVRRWYEHYYRLWSDESHASPRALVGVSEDLEHGAANIGPHNRDPWFVLLGVSEFGFQVLVQVNKLYRHRQRRELGVLGAEYQAAFSAVPHAPTASAGS